MTRLHWELQDSTGRPVRYGARWLRSAIIPSCKPGPYCAWPGTLVLGASLHSGKMTVFYVTVHGFWPEGLWYPRKRHHNSLVVCASSLGPTYQRGRKVTRVDRNAFLAARNTAKEHWRGIDANFAPVALFRNWRESLVDWLTQRRVSALKIMLDSETGIRYLKNHASVQYCRQTVIHPTVPNHIHESDLGPGKQIIAVAEIFPQLQAMGGVRQWCQRVWYLDHTIGDKGHFDGQSMPLPGDDNIVDWNKIHANISSVRFDTGNLTPIDPDQRWRWVENKTRILKASNQQGTP